MHHDFSVQFASCNYMGDDQSGSGGLVTPESFILLKNARKCLVLRDVISTVDQALAGHLGKPSELITDDDLHKLDISEHDIEQLSKISLGINCTENQGATINYPDEWDSISTSARTVALFASMRFCLELFLVLKNQFDQKAVNDEVMH